MKNTDKRVKTKVFVPMTERAYFVDVQQAP